MKYMDFKNCHPIFVNVSYPLWERDSAVADCHANTGTLVNSRGGGEAGGLFAWPATLVLPGASLDL